MPISVDEQICGNRHTKSFVQWRTVSIVFHELLQQSGTVLQRQLEPPVRAQMTHAPLQPFFNQWRTGSRIVPKNEAPLSHQLVAHVLYRMRTQSYKHLIRKGSINALRFWLL